MTSKIPEFLQNKWKQVFKLFDFNNDGVLNQEKFADGADSISKANHSDKEQTNKTRIEWVKWFSCFQTDPSISVDEGCFVSRNAQLYQDVEQMKQINSATAAAIFDTLDRNKNGIISAKEFELFYKAFEKQNRTTMLEIFAKIDTDGDGFIRREEFIDDHVRFFTDPDPVSGKAYLFSMPSEIETEIVTSETPTLFSRPPGGFEHLVK